MMQISHSITLQMCSVIWTVESIWVQWTHCYDQKISLRWFDICDVMCYPAASSKGTVHCVIKGWTLSATIFRYAVGFKLCSNGANCPTVCQENVPHTTSLNCQCKAGWSHDFMLFMPNLNPTIWMSQQKWRFIRPGNVSEPVWTVVSISCS